VSAINAGPAFPCPVEFDPNGQIVSHGSFGMTLRDWFAGQALAGIATQWNGIEFYLRSCGGGDANEVRSFMAYAAYNQADAMLKAREVKP
jgi:hypothetical protein